MKRLVMFGACALIVAMFFANKDMGGDPSSPRGDGVYRPVLARGDGHMLYLMARSTALDLDWDFTNDLARFGDPWHEPITATGRKSIVHPIGPALVWTPLIWFGEASAAIANVFGAEIPMHGYTLWHQRIVFLSSALFACGAVLLARRQTIRLLAAPWAATYAAVCILLGTSLTYYATNMPSYSHAMDAFACSAFLFYWVATVGRVDRRRWLMLGALLGVAALIRTQELGLGIVVAFEVTVRVVRRERPLAWICGAALALAIAILVLVPQLVEWHVVFGSARGLPQGARFTRPSTPMVGELLFAPRNGWFSSTPIAYAGVVGLLVAPKRARFVAIGLLLAIAMQVYLSSIVLDWWSSASFGQRRLCDVSGPLVFGLAALIHRAGVVSRLPVYARHVLLVVFAAPFVAWNLDRVDRLTSGKAAPAELVPTCCSNVPRAVRPWARWIYDHIGNPFELPASAWFAIEHDVPLSRWDRTIGNYPLVPGITDLSDANYVGLRGVWRIGSEELTPYVVDGWSKPRASVRCTVAERATVIVTNLVPEMQRVELWVEAPSTTWVGVEWNGGLVAFGLVKAATALGFAIPVGDVHANELSILGRGACVSRLEIVGIGN